MSYIVMKVYSFECDHITDRHGLGGLEEILPQQGTGLRGALKELRGHGWTVRDGEHFCPEHKPQEDDR